MKRLVTGVLALGLLSACAGISAPAAARSDTPAQSLATTRTDMAKLNSLRFDLRATLTLPQAAIDQIRAKAGSRAGFLAGGTSVKLTITGAVARPGQLQAAIQATVGSLTVNTEVIATGGQLYVKNPMTEKWQLLPRHSAAAQGTSKPALSYQSILDTAKTLTELNDQPSTLDGVSVDHYRVVPDLAKLFTLVTAGRTTSNGQAMAAAQALLQSASVIADIWTGSADHLVRRVNYDATADLHALSGLTPPTGTGVPAFSFPAGSVARLTAVVNLHDFNSKVSIQAPTVTPRSRQVFRGWARRVPL